MYILFSTKFWSYDCYSVADLHILIAHLILSVDHGMISVAELNRFPT